jgi:hypothetical protein
LGVRPFYLLPRSCSLYNWTKQLPVGAAPGSSISYCLSLGLNAARMMCTNVLNWKAEFDSLFHSFH